MNFLLKYKPIAKLVSKTKEMLITGSTPHQLSMAITLGAIFGILPFLGVTTIVLAFLAVVFRLNMVVIQLANYMVYPLQLLCYLPFLKMGKFLGNIQSISATQVFEIMKENWINGIERLWLIHVWAIIAWALIVIPVGLIVYRLLKNTIHNIKNRLRNKTITHTTTPGL